MGVIANTMLALGGKVIGVLPKALANIEIAHKHRTELHIVDSSSKKSHNQSTIRWLYNMTRWRWLHG